MKGTRKSPLLITIIIVMLLVTACNTGNTSGENGSPSSSPTEQGQQSAASESKKGPGENPSLNESGFPITNEPIKLDFVAGLPAGSHPDWNDAMLFNEYEKMTGIDIQWQMISTSVLEEQRNIILASGELPDAFYAALIPDGDVMKYGQQGMFIPLNDLIDKYAPNIKKLLDENPDIRKGLTMPDGNIYSIPRVYDPGFTSVLVNPKQWINTKWAETLNLKLPETTDEFYNYLKAIKEGDPNGNGEADEIPYGADGIGRLTKYLHGAWGLQNRGSRHAYVDVNPETKELRFFPTDPKYKEMLEYINKLYSEELIDQDIFTVNSSELLARLQEDVYGVYNSWDPESWGNVENFVGAPALAGPNGDKLVVSNSPLTGLGHFVITSANEYPEATMRWIDYFFSEEGSEMFFMGFEGVTFKRNADGTTEFLDEIANNPNGLSFDQAIAQYLVWPGGGMPGILSQKYFHGGESLPLSVEAAELLEPYLPEETWPPFSFTTEENTRMAAISSDISTYIREMQAKFITGEVPFSEWESYVETIQKMGLAEYMEIYQAAYERYKNG